MIRSIEINGLRGIREGRLAELTRLVILVGPNGAGKSTVLDALLIGASPHIADAVGQAVVRREGISRGGRWLLWKGGAQGPAEIVVSADSPATRTCKLSLSISDESTTEIQIELTDESASDSKQLTRRTELYGDKRYAAGQEHLPFDGVTDARFIDPHFSASKTPLHRLYTRIVEQGLQSDAKAIISSLIADVENIQILTEGDLPVVYLVFKDHAVPAALAGDGARLLLQMTLELVTHRSGLLLMEEPEVHLHPGAIRQCAHAIVAAVRRGTQVVLTTHSLELIDALVSESSDADLQLMSLYSLQLDGGLLKSFRMAGPDVALSRTQIQDDLR